MTPSESGSYAAPSSKPPPARRNRTMKSQLKSQIAALHRWKREFLEQKKRERERREKERDRERLARIREEEARRRREAREEETRKR